MRYGVLLVISNVIVISLSKDVDQRQQPTCHIKYGDVVSPCAYFKERSLEKLLEETWTAQPVTSVSNGNDYTNLTMVFKRKLEMNSLFVIVRYNEFPLPLQTWEIQPMKSSLSRGPLTVTISFAPNVGNTSEYRLRRIVDPTRLLEEQSCNKTETNEECRILKNSKLFVRKSSGNVMSLSISHEKPIGTLDVEILSAHCDITCSGEINACSGVKIRNMYWSDTSEPLQIFNSNNDSSVSYYCSRISPARHECCMVYTETLPLYSSDNISESPITFSHRGYITERILVVSLAIALIASVMFSLKKMFGSDIYKCWPYNKIGSQESVQDVLLKSSHEDLSPSKISVPPLLQQKLQNVEVLLIYHKQIEETSKFMPKFRYILSLYVSKIWDPFDEEEIEKVSENPSMWIENVLNNEAVKVILVENAQMVEWYEQCQQNRPTFHYHHLDNLFLYILSILHNNPYLCLNYQRLFIVRFPSSKVNKSSNIVPCTRYEIPQNLGKLITDLIGSQEQQNEQQVEVSKIPGLEVLETEFVST